MGEITPGEKFRNVFIGGPVHRNAKIITVSRLEIGLVPRIIEPVIAKPVKVGELLGRQLIELPIRASGKAGAHKVRKIKRRQGDICGLPRHPVGQVAHLLIPPVRADQIRVVDIGIIDIFAGLHLGLEFFNHVAFTNQIMSQLDSGDGLKGRGQHLAFVLVGGDGL